MTDKRTEFCERVQRIVAERYRWSASLAEIDAVLDAVDIAGYEIVPKGSCDCEDSYPELSRAAGHPVPADVASVTWGWGSEPSNDER